MMLTLHLKPVTQVYSKIGQQLRVHAMADIGIILDVCGGLLFVYKVYIESLYVALISVPQRPKQVDHWV